MSYPVSDKHLINAYESQDFVSRNISVPNIMVYVRTILFIRIFNIFAQQTDKLNLFSLRSV